VEVSCIILAGGKSSRIEEDKAFLVLNKQPLIKHVFNHMKNIFSDIIVVVKNEEQKNKMEKILKNVRIVEDKNEIFSPMAGIQEGVKHAANDYVFVIACDMPFVDEETVKILLSKIKEGVECVVYSKENRYEPLCAAYKKEIFVGCDLKGSLHSLINRTENKILIPFNEDRIFFNINTEEDLEFAEKTFK